MDMNGPWHPHMRGSCVVINCPNKSKLIPQAFKTQIQATNINFKNQPILVLTQHEPYVYLGINLVSSLQWKTQTRVATTKLIKQCILLITCLATMKQKNKMLDTIFYAIPTIKKLNSKVLTLYYVPKLNSSTFHSIET